MLSIDHAVTFLKELREDISRIRFVKRIIENID